jgi:plastocyanin
MDGGLFFPIGIALVFAAVILSAIGIRGRESFPPSRPVLVGVTLLFAAIVVGTTSLAVVNARDEKEHRDEELAEEEEQAEAEQPVPPSEGGTPPEEPPPGAAPAAGKPPPEGAATMLDLTSPEDGSLVFEPDALKAPPGTVTLAYENPSPVTHNINIEADGGNLAASDDITNGEVDVSAQLGPGEYVYYCSIPGHREGGMEGDLVVE